MFANSRRMIGVSVLVLVTALILMVVVLTIRWRGTETTLRGRFATPSATRLPLSGGSSTPEPTLTPLPLPDLGDPRPVVLDVTNAWLAGRPVADHMDPTAYEDALAHAAPAGLAVTGTARLQAAGPEGATVLVPLGARTLAVDVAAEQGQWMVTGLGWLA